MYKLLKQCGRAKRGELTTPHGTIQTPVFMNVGTLAAIKGAVSTEDLEEIKCQVQLSNTYHLHIRPGDKIVHQLGGLHKFMSWNKPILTDSGGFQVFSLAALRKIKEEGVYFASHVDGRKIFMGPEESMQIQSNLASTIAMAFDECPSAVADRTYVQNSVDRTTRWLIRSKNEMDRLNTLDDTINKQQMLFGINQGAIFSDIRIEHAKIISEFDLDGYAIGGLAVGETHDQMYHILEETVPYLPKNKPTYLMGVGTPENILEAVERGVDFFDCVLPARNGRHAHVYTNYGKINLLNAKFELDDEPIEPGCQCPACKRYSRAYIRHLFKAKEMLAMRLCVLHNLYYFNTLMEEIRTALDEDRFVEYKKQKLDGFKRGVEGKPSSKTRK
jgi:tRNA-guanine transglycosylase, queuosine-34-forming